MNSAVNNFITKVQSIDDPDYGDFMRRANLYLNDLCEELFQMGDSIGCARAKKIHGYLQYSPSWEIESTRKKVLQDASEIGCPVVDTAFGRSHPRGFVQICTQ